MRLFKALKKAGETGTVSSESAKARNQDYKSIIYWLFNTDEMSRESAKEVYKEFYKATDWKVNKKQK